MIFCSLLLGSCFSWLIFRCCTRDDVCISIEPPWLLATKCGSLTRQLSPCHLNGERPRRIEGKPSWSVQSDLDSRQFSARHSVMGFRIFSRLGTFKLTRLIRQPAKYLSSQQSPCKTNVVESRCCDYHVWVHAPPAGAGLNHRSIGSQLSNLGIRVAIDVAENDQLVERAERMVTSACMCVFIIWDDFFYDQRSLRLLRRAVELGRPIVVVIAPGATFRIKPPRSQQNEENRFETNYLQEHNIFSR